ncbi:hypothetical protein ACSSS7_002182 [Eimeria intestinalis]
MRANVHIYCTRPASTIRDPDSGFSIVEMINSADTAENKKNTRLSGFSVSSSADTERLMKATKVLIEDLVEQQFGDVPISSLVILGRYPVAKLMMMQKFLDQSTVIDNLTPLLLLDSARLSLLSGSFAEGVSREKVAALETYLSVYEQASRRGTDEQWKEVKASLEFLTSSATKKASFDSVLDAARNFARGFARACATKTGLHDYLELLEETLAKQAKNDIQMVAMIYEFIANAANLTASPNALEKLKDSIENACELAESRPQLLLPALRLIQAGLLGEEDVVKVYKVLEGFKKLGSQADVSALSTALSALEL